MTTCVCKCGNIIRLVGETGTVKLLLWKMFKMFSRNKYMGECQNRI